MADDIDSFDVDQLELDRHKLLMKKIEDAGLSREGRYTLSVSMPLNEINDYKDACVLRGEKWRDPVREFCKKYVEETNDIAMRNAKKQADFWNNNVRMIEARNKADGSLIEKAIRKAVDDGVMDKIEKMVTRGRYSQVVDNTNPIEYKTITAIWNMIPAFVRDKNKKGDVERCMKVFEERVKRIKNTMVRESALKNLELLKHRQFPEIYQAEKPIEAEDLKKKSVGELIQMDRDQARSE